MAGMAMRDFTTDGLRWILAGLGIVFLGEAALLAVFQFVPLDMSARLLLPEAFPLLPVAAFALGIAALPGLRRGQWEYGPAHATAIGWAFRSVPVVIAGAAGIFVTGLILGFVPLGRTMSGALEPTAPYLIVRGLRTLSGVLLMGGLGLFLFWTIRDLATGETVLLGGAAFATAILATAEGLIGTDFGVSSAYLSLTSLGLWTAVYAITLIRLRRGAAFPRSASAIV